ncbi:hypothetical protein D3C84_995540 [compost metagenome]
MGGIGPPHHVAGVFQHGMLKTTAGAQERATLFAGKTNCLQGAGFVLVGAARHAPDTVEVLQHCVVGDERRCQPLDANVMAGLPAGQLKCNGNRPVSGDVWVVVADQGDV